MNRPSPRPEERRPQTRERGVADAVRTAVERTMRATAGSAATTRDRAADLVDEVARLGLEARDAIAKRGQEAGAGLARRGQEATGEVGRRLEALERRLAELEGRLGDARAEVDPESSPGPETNPKAEG